MARLFVGLMSGTSIDGVDAALVDLSPGAAPRTLALESTPMPAALREELTRLAGGDSTLPDPVDACCRAGRALARTYASTVDRLLGERDRRSVVAVGAHGQTVRHAPDHGYSLQLLDGALLAELCGLPVACDFRAADLAAGGQGAPLVPAYHADVFGSSRERRAILNIGGIANLSLIAPGEPVLGMDTGPGNTLLDAWHERHLGGAFDDRGQWAAGAEVEPKLLEALLADPYFGRAAPKSTGREYFNLRWLDARLASLAGPCPEAARVQATLLELTARTVADALSSWRPDRLLVCGGGIRNDTLMTRLRALLAPVECESTATMGIDPQAVEASAFAWLAARRIDGLPGNMPSVTGARGARVLGALYAPWPEGQKERGA